MGRVKAASFALAGGLALTLAAFAADELETATATSRDGVRIEYAIGGEGGPTLVFIHGWTCDRSYWSEQLPYFVRGHKVIAVDLAGHGASGAERDDYTMRSFGEDVAAAVGDEESVILIGHSMGGPVALQAARLLGDRVLGIVAVDSLNDTGGPVPEPAAIDVGSIDGRLADLDPAAFRPRAESRIADAVTRALPALAQDWPHWRGPGYDGATAEMVADINPTPFVPHIDPVHHSWPAGSPSLRSPGPPARPADRRRR